MAKFKGKGLLESYSCEIELANPVSVDDIGTLLKIPKEYSENLIIVRDSMILNKNDQITNKDEIVLFLSTLGG